MNPTARLHWQSALPDAAVAVLALLAWCMPMTVGLATVKAVTLALLGELLLLGADFFLARATHRASRLQALLGTLLVLGLIAPAPLLLSLHLDAYWPLAAIGMLAASRLGGVWWHSPHADAQYRAGEKRVLTLIGVWFGVCLLTLFAADLIPHGGLQAGIGRVIWGDGIGGVWMEQPQVPLAAALLYFSFKATACAVALPRGRGRHTVRAGGVAPQRRR